MSKKEPLILYNQDEFNVEEDCRAQSLDFDDWDTPEKVSTLLWYNASLAGEFEFSDEFKSDLYSAAAANFKKLASSKKAVLNSMEQQVLTLEAVVLTQNMELQQDETKLWNYLFSSLGYDEQDSSMSHQQLYKRCTEMLGNILTKHKRIYADFGEGNKYYNTLNIHALAPSWGIEHLFNILYSFYSKNLEFHYEPHDPSFELLVKNISKRWEDEREKESDLKLRSDALSSSLKMLFIYRPHFMAAVCDALTERMDTVLKGEADQLNSQSRWDNMLISWYNQKTAYDQKHMAEQRKKASKERVITRKEEIQPQYSLISEELYLSVPRIRLPEITSLPVAELLQNGTVVKRKNLSVFGDDLCLTTREFEFSLGHIDSINWYAPFNFTLRILCGENEVYQSGTSLFRSYFLFSERGQEIRSLRHKRSSIYALANSKANVELSDSSDNTQIGCTGQLFKINLAETDRFFVDDIDVLAQGQSGNEAFYYLSEASEDEIYIESDEIKYDVYHSAPQLTVELPRNETAKDYFLYIDSHKHVLCEYGENNCKVSLHLPATSKFFHNVELRRFSDNKTVFKISYVILPQFGCEYNMPIYPNKYCEGSVKVHCMGNTKTIKFELAENQKELEFELWKNAICHLSVPKINAVISGRNAFSMPEQIWFGEIELEDFLRMELNGNYKASLLLGTDYVSAQGQYWELGNYLHSKSEWPYSEMPLGIVVREKGKIVFQEFLTSVVFEEKFNRTPVFTYEDKKDGELKYVIEWNPEDLYIGPPDSEFRVDLEVAPDETWNFREDLKKRNIQKDFPCREGYYHYKIFLRGKKKFFSSTPDKLIYEDELLIGDPNISRFYDREIRLRKVCYWSVVSGGNETADIKDGNAILTDLYYIGLTTPEGEENCYPEYEATLCFERPNGEYQKLCSNKYSSDREWTNPVSIWLLNDSKVQILARNGGPLLVNTKRINNNSTVRIVDSYSKLSKDEQYKYINDADYFEYEVVPGKER